MPHRTERSRNWTSRLKCSPNDLHLRPLAVQVDVCFDFASDIWSQIGVNSLSSLFHAVIIFNTLLVPWNTPIIYRPCLSISPHINTLSTVIHRSRDPNDITPSLSLSPLRQPRIYTSSFASHTFMKSLCMRAFASQVQVQDINLFRVGRSVQRCPQPVTLYIICSLLETSNFSSGLIVLYWDVPPPCTWCTTVHNALSVVHISFGVDCFILRRRMPLHMMCEYGHCNTMSIFFTLN